MSDVQLHVFNNERRFDRLSDFSEQNIKKNSSKVADKNNVKILKIIFIILCVLLIIEAVFYKFIIPLNRYPKINFEGIKTYTEQELISEILVNQNTSWFKFDTEKVASVLSSKPGIESVSVVKRFPDIVSINVKEREGVALTFLIDNNRSVPIQIDKNGVLFTTNVESPISDRTIPIVSGLPVEHLTNGMRIPQKYRSLIEQIAKIRSLPQKYFVAISEICVVPKEYGNYELVLYPVGSKAKVLTDRSLSEEALQYMMVVLDIVKSLDSSVSEIDLRYGSVSYRTDNGGK